MLFEPELSGRKKGRGVSKERLLLSHSSPLTPLYEPGLEPRQVLQLAGNFVEVSDAT